MSLKSAIFHSHQLSNRLTYTTFFFRPECWLYQSKEILNTFMKRLLEFVVNFLRREWFLLVTIATIAVIILLFELL